MHERRSRTLETLQSGEEFFFCALTGMSLSLPPCAGHFQLPSTLRRAALHSSAAGRENALLVAACQYSYMSQSIHITADSGIGTGPLVIQLISISYMQESDKLNLGSAMNNYKVFFSRC